MAVSIHPHAPVSRSELPWALRHGALAGLIAGVVFAAFELLVTTVMYGAASMQEPVRMVGAILLGPPATYPSYPIGTAALAAAAVHFGLSALYGAAFAAAAGGLRSGPIVIGLGAAYGLVLWLVNFYLIAPVMFPWFEGAEPIAQFVGNTGFYGAVLGFLLWQQHETLLTSPPADA